MSVVCVALCLITCNQMLFCYSVKLNWSNFVDLIQLESECVSRVSESMSQLAYVCVGFKDVIGIYMNRVEECILNICIGVLIISSKSHAVFAFPILSR